MKQYQTATIHLENNALKVPSRGAVLTRAREIALINNHPSQEILKSDIEQAQRELSSGNTGPYDSELELLSATEYWGTPPASHGHRSSESHPSDEEDDEGRSTGEQLVEKGVMEADHEQRLQSLKQQAFSR